MHKKVDTAEDALIALLEDREEGLDYFFMNYYSQLTYFAWKMLQDQFIAEETAAESFVKLWNKREQLTDARSIKAWLYSTVRNACIDHLRKSKRMQISKNEVAYLHEKTETSILHHMIEAETIQQILNTLNFLPPKCSEVFRMFYIQGKSYEEIAAEMNISPHTARNQKKRAVRLLRKQFPNLSVLLAMLS
jgi:RNA polymerase sigma-70 factor (family 1)